MQWVKTLGKCFEVHFHFVVEYQRHCMRNIAIYVYVSMQYFMRGKQCEIWRDFALYENINTIFEEAMQQLLSDCLKSQIFYGKWLL